MKKVAVFCGSSEGKNPDFIRTADKVGQYMANKNIGLVYGGGKVGMMGAVSNAVIRGNGHVTGVIPGFMKQKELANPNVEELIEVETMHERKEVMSDLADAFLILPGGIGTMDEFFEIFTWRQLGLHTKNIAILDVEDYYDPLWQQLERMVSQSYLSIQSLDSVFKSDSLNNVFDFLLK